MPPTGREIIGVVVLLYVAALALLTTAYLLAWS